MAIDTIPALFLHAAKTHDKPDAFQYKRGGAYVNVSHREVFEAVDAASRGVVALGLARGDRVALLSENRYEWVVADLAILSAGMICVPIYATLPAKQIEYILRDSEARAVFVSTRGQLEKIQSVRSGLSGLLHVITMEDTGDGGAAITLRDVIERGRSAPATASLQERASSIGKYDWASIIYTSGTTGDPKGAILNHWNFVSNVTTALKDFELGPNDRCLSFLPLSHVFERTGGYYAMLLGGATIAYAESVDTVPQNLLEVRPTVMVSVPRLYEKMYARILSTVTAGSALKKAMFFWAGGVGRRFVRETFDGRVKRTTKAQYRIANRLVFRKLQARTGGRLRFFVSGGAPLSREIAEFFYAAGLPIFEGYGLTETSPIVSVNTPAHFKFGTVGRPIEGVHVQIAPDGEVLVKGPNVMLGYYKKPDLTSAVLDGEWFHTGDIGHIDDEGFLTIADRKKDIIVTSGGKKVAPQAMENLLKSSIYIAQAIVIGDKRNFLSAVIVPNIVNVRAFAEAEGISNRNDADLIRDPKVIRKIDDEIKRVSENLASFEKIKKFILIEKEFTVEAAELTPTLKIRRAIIEKKLQKEIDALYAS